MFPVAMQKAESGMMNMPTVIEVSAVVLRISCVTMPTVSPSPS